MLYYDDFAQKTNAEDALRSDTPNRNKGNALLRHALRVLPLAVLGTMLEACAPPSPGVEETTSTLGTIESNPFLSTVDSANSFTGGSGSDWVSYAGHDNEADGAAGVTIDLSQEAQPGEAGDTLISIENVRGSNQNDEISGNDVANTFRGRGGDDTLLGREGDDVLEGGAGGDTLDGGIGQIPPATQAIPRGL